jgi:hypothetical protein
MLKSKEMMSNINNSNPTKAFLKKNLVAKETSKRKCNQACSNCGADVVRGERYMSVQYNDGFVKKFYGAFHMDCWDTFNKSAT